MRSLQRTRWIKHKPTTVQANRKFADIVGKRWALRWSFNTMCTQYTEPLLYSFFFHYFCCFKVKVFSQLGVEIRTSSFILFISSCGKLAALKVCWTFHFSFGMATIWPDMAPWERKRRAVVEACHEFTGWARRAEHPFDMVNRVLFMQIQSRLVNGLDENGSGTRLTDLTIRGFDTTLARSVRPRISL